jgi:hypothetical protein
MLLLKRQSVSRHGYLLPARVGSAAPWPAEVPGEPPGLGASIGRQDIDINARIARHGTIGSSHVRPHGPDQAQRQQPPHLY